MTIDLNNKYIEVYNLTKKIDNFTVIENLSFTVKKGEILGLLGPNGAGKSTTMKTLVGSIKPTSGVVKIYGNNMCEENQDAKDLIGYLPEHNPLYLDMYVSEYLEFTAKLRNIKILSIPDRIDQVIHECGLEKVYNKKINTLSKGYRQRVGLAQALIHDPIVLVLDEPTTGLDPKQILEIRNLIKSISLHKAVIISTHIMQEVEILCTNLLILKSGKMILHETIDAIKTKNSYKVIVEFKQTVPETDFHLIKTADKIEKQIETRFLFYPQTPLSTLQEDIFNFAKIKNYTILEMKRIDNSIESIFSNAINDN